MYKIHYNYDCGSNVSLCGALKPLGSHGRTYWASHKRGAFTKDGPSVTCGNCLRMIHAGKLIRPRGSILSFDVDQVRGGWNLDIVRLKGGMRTADRIARFGAELLGSELDEDAAKAIALLVEKWLNEKLKNPIAFAAEISALTDKT